MAVVAAIGTVASLALQGYGMYEENKAAKRSAALAQQTAAYNAEVDKNAATQIELNTAANLIEARKAASVYTSRQRAAFATSGVLNSGSPLAVEVATAGRLEQQAQQMRVDALQEAEQRRTAARLGILYGDAQASAIRTSATARLIRGGVGMLSTIKGAYESGTFADRGPVTWGGASGTPGFSY